MNTMDGTRSSVTIGWSKHTSTKRALEQILEPFSSLRGELGLVLLYASVRHDLRRLAAGINDALGNAPLIGCTTTGEFCSSGHSMGGVVLGGISSDALAASCGFGRDVYRDPVNAGRRAASMASSKLGDLSGIEAKNKVCLLHTAGFTMTENAVEEDVLLGIQDVLDDGWTILGGSAGDECKYLQNFQLTGDQVFDDAVALTLMTTDLEISQQMAHGFTATDVTCKVTRSRDYAVEEIDGKLALDFYADLLSVPRSKMNARMGLVRLTDKVPKFLLSLSQRAGLTPKLIMDSIPFYTYAIEHPFGIKTPTGAIHLKAPKRISAEGYLEFYHRIPEGQELHLLELDEELTLNAAPRAISKVKEELGAEPSLCLVFDCVGRFMYFNAVAEPLYRRIRESTSADILGFFSGGEQGSMEGLGCRSHNYAVSVLGIGTL